MGTCDSSSTFSPTSNFASLFAATSFPGAGPNSSFPRDRASPAARHRVCCRPSLEDLEVKTRLKSTLNIRFKHTFQAPCLPSAAIGTFTAGFNRAFTPGCTTEGYDVP